MTFKDFIVHVTQDVSISVLLEDILDVLALEVEEMAFAERIKNAKSVDGGKRIRIPLEYEKM